MAVENKLLVEGPNDLHVVSHLCLRKGVPEFGEIQSFKGGVSELLESFPVQVKGSGLKALGALVDADSDIASRWQSLRDPLVQSGYADVPPEPDVSGTIVEPPSQDLPRVGIWLMPDNSESGILEDFLRLLIPKNRSRLHNHVKNSIAKIPKDIRLFPETRASKAEILTWLAWQEDPGLPMGTAIKASYFDPGVPEAEAFIAWLRRLFEV